MMQMQVSGLKELVAALRKFPEELARREIAKALRPSAEIMRTDIAFRAPVRDVEDGDFLKERKRGRVTAPGHLKAHIVLRMRTVQGIPTALIGWAKSAFWGAMNEWGTSRQPPRPFARPGFDSTAPEVLREFAFRLRLGVERTAKKLYAKAK